MNNVQANRRNIYEVNFDYLIINCYLCGNMNKYEQQMHAWETV